MTIELLPEKPFQALCALATYRYLTTKQLVDLGIASSPAVARDYVLRKLERHHKPLAKAHNLGRWVGYGQLPYIHCLTKRGAKVLVDYFQVPLEKIEYPKGGVQFSRDIFHRIGVIDCHIRLRQWAQRNKISVTVSDLYFDKIRKGAKTEARTRLYLKSGDFIEPDGIFGFRKADQEIFFALEFHRFTDTSRIVEQLQKHAKILSEGSLAKKYQNLHPYFVLSVHHHEAIMKRVQQKLMQVPSFKTFSDGFLFNTAAQIRLNLRQNWQSCNGNSIKPF